MPRPLSQFLCLISLVIFRLIRQLILLESDLIALLKRLVAEKRETVEFFNVLSRYQLDSTEPIRECDFIIFHERFGSFDEITDSRWHIYCVTSNYVYFGCAPFTDLSIENQENLTVSLFQDTNHVARMQIDDFLLQSRQYSKLQDEVVFLYSPPSSGGTRTAKLLQSADATHNSLLVLNEPPVFTSLTILSRNCSIEITRQLCARVMLYLLRHQKRQQTYAVKLRSPSICLIPYIHEVFPSISHVYISSRSYTHTTEQLLHLTNQTMPLFQSMADTATTIRPLLEICQISSLSIPECIEWKRREDETLRRFADALPLTDEQRKRTQNLADSLRSLVVNF
ncbi:hypothetical protein WR25_07557 [Diploscapter pachys]|uniref:Uncharacterized protein n=1 Tax=Diploscapter pachys TaxID=2018661 RepID=A0A2A2JRV2_9BILA|nr:hypothetical protein WR25_07557 [Diploscapter pachys]